MPPSSDELARKPVLHKRPTQPQQCLPAVSVKENDDFTQWTTTVSLADNIRVHLRQALKAD
jgi:hypothetical protein